jgi:hypothetical protein
LTIAAEEHQIVANGIVVDGIVADGIFADKHEHHAGGAGLQEEILTEGADGLCIRKRCCRRGGGKCG